MDSHRKFSKLVQVGSGPEWTSGLADSTASCKLSRLILLCEVSVIIILIYRWNMEAQKVK